MKIIFVERNRNKNRPSVHSNKVFFRFHSLKYKKRERNIRELIFLHVFVSPSLGKGSWDIIVEVSGGHFVPSNIFGG